jgi:hypothetical protein
MTAKLMCLILCEANSFKLPLLSLIELVTEYYKKLNVTI